ncbi:MAG: DegV family protein [Candidatus Heimdallarchaeota archaeon]
MAKIKIVTDSTSDISPELAKKHNIDVLALNIFFGDDHFKHGVDITASEVYGMMESGIYDWPRTSQPSAKEFMEVYQKIFDDGYDSIISIHVTTKMSGTTNSAQLAINQFKGKDITLIDSNTVTLPLGLLVIEAAKLVKTKKSKEEILKQINEYVATSQIWGVIDTLDNLHKGGRIGTAKKILGTLLNKKPLMQVVDGLVDSFGSVKGHDEGYAKFLETMPIIFDNLETDSIWLGFADNKDYIDKVYNEIIKLPNVPKNIEIVEIGPAVGVHIGPGAMLIGWLGKWDTKWVLGK